MQLILQKFDTKVNTTVSHEIGNQQCGTSQYFDGYISEVVLLMELH
jgi:hypothetical protein